MTTLAGRAVAVLGYGNQGRAHSLNLRDSGVQVRVGARPGPGFDSAQADGFEPLPLSEAVRGCEVAALLVPDEAMKLVFREEVAPHLEPQAGLVLAHGFAVTYHQVDWAGRMSLVSPAGPGVQVREAFVAGSGVPAFIAGDLDLAVAYATALGSARVRLIETTFQAETECDLFGEQVVLCGGMPELACAAYETLVDAGYQPELAYTECVAQIRLLADLIARHGIRGMRERISDTAEYGAYVTGPEVVGEDSREAMRLALRRIQSGRFADEWLEEASHGKQRLAEYRRIAAERPIEQTFSRLN